MTKRILSDLSKLPSFKDGKIEDHVRRIDKKAIDQAEINRALRRVGQLGAFLIQLSLNSKQNYYETNR
jgi:hypothetical protein